jgi:hypothetical protein
MLDKTLRFFSRRREGGKRLQLKATADDSVFVM